jgi:hypothetical protein
MRGPLGGRVRVEDMLRFTRSDQRWWNKPLVNEAGEELPAELIILRSLLRLGEQGAWMNSRGRKSGVVALQWDKKGSAKTIRRNLPDFVAHVLGDIYKEANLSRGCLDLVIWNHSTQTLRLVEVKCPHWDRPSDDQQEFMRVAAARGIPTQVVEWEFAER